MSEEIDTFRLYVQLVKKHFPNIQTLVMSDSFRERLEKLPLAIKILQENGSSKDDSERNALLSINKHLEGDAIDWLA